MKFIQYRSKKLDSKKVSRQKRDYVLSFHNYADKHIYEEEFKDHINLRLVTDCSSLQIVEKSAFYGCFNLMRFDAGVKLVSEDSFAYCWNLDDFNWLPLVSIGKRAFAHSGIKSFYGSEPLDIIPEGAFEACTKLKKVFLNKIEIIEKDAFLMTAVRVLNLPITLEKIGPGAFSSCFQLSNIVCEAPEPPRIYATTFSNDPIQNIWFFSEVQKEHYLKNSIWKKYESKMRVTTPKELKNFLMTEQTKWMDLDD